MKFSSTVLLALSTMLLAGCSSHAASHVSEPKQSYVSPSTTSASTEKAVIQKSTQNYHQYLKSKYDIAFNLSDDWETKAVKVYPNGYAKFYVPKGQSNYAQSIIFHYFKEEKITPKQFFTKAKEVTAQLNCKVEKTNIKKLDKNFVVFEITSQQCPTIHDLLQVYKAFGMSDGLYTLSYRAKLKNTSKEDRSSISMNIENAKIVEK